MTISALDPFTPLHSNTQPPAAPKSDSPSAAKADDSSATSGHAKPFAGDAFSFWDLVDIVNPLQHIPIISTLYRHITGDEIGFVAKMAGDALIGGPLGFAASVANVIIEDMTGSDIGDHVYAALLGDDDKSSGTALAKNDAPPAPLPTDAAASTERLGTLPSTANTLPSTATSVADNGNGEKIPEYSPLLAASNRPSFGLITQPSQPLAPASEQLASLNQTPAIRTLLTRSEPRYMPTPMRGVPSTGAHISPGTQGGMLEAQTANNAARRQMFQPAQAPESENTAPPGAWFTTAMGSALGKYEQAKKLQVQ